MSRLEKRLQELEKALEIRSRSGLWIDCHNNSVRIDSRAQKGKRRSFDTVLDASRFIEAEIDSHDNVFGSLVFDDIFQLYKDPEGLKNIIEEIMPLSILTEKSGVVFGDLKTSFNADINLLIVRSLLMNFASVGFHKRWSTGEFRDIDKKIVAACFELFQWEREGDPEEIWDIFAGLFMVVSGLHSVKIASDYLTESEAI